MLKTIYGEINKPQLLGPVFEGANAAYFAVPGLKGAHVLPLHPLAAPVTTVACGKT